MPICAVIGRRRYLASNSMLATENMKKKKTYTSRAQETSLLTSFGPFLVPRCTVLYALLVMIDFEVECCSKDYQQRVYIQTIRENSW